MMLGLKQPGKLSRCVSHRKMMPIEAFDMNPKTNLPFSKCRNCKVTAHNYDVSDAGKRSSNASNAKRKKNGKHKECRDRYVVSELGLANAQRGKLRRKQLVHNNKAEWLIDTLKRRAGDLMSGRIKNSPTFVSHSGFASADAFVAHMKAEAAKVVDDGSGKQNEHRIPAHAYDHSDPEDTRRCWSQFNMHVMTGKANKEKSYKLLDEYINQVPPEFRPKWFKGGIPNQEQKEAFYAKCKAGTTQAGGAGSSSAAYTSEGEDLEAESLESDSAEESSAEEDSDLEEEDLASGSAAASSAAAEMDQEAEDSAMEGSVEGDSD